MRRANASAKVSSALSVSAAAFVATAPLERMTRHSSTSVDVIVGTSTGLVPA